MADQTSGYINVTNRPANYQYSSKDISNLPSDLTNKTSQQLSDLGWQQASNIIPQSQNVVSGTDDIRNNAQNLSNTIKNSPLNNTNSSNIPLPPQSMFSDPNAIQQYYTNAINQAKSSTQPSINQAQQEAQQGMAKATVAAGEAGGFESTQFAGMAALKPTEGNTWAGNGGQLEYANSAFQYNIQQAQLAQQTAMQQAAMSAQQYIQSGQQQDYENAITAYNAAQTAQTNAFNQQIAAGQYQMQMAQFPLEMQQLASQSGYSTSQYVQTALAPSMADEIAAGGNMNDVISKYSQQYGLDPSQLTSGVINYQQSQLKANWLNSSEAANVISKTADGAKIQTPLGEMQVMGQTLKTNDGMYYRMNPVTGQYESVGIPPSTNINQLLSLVDKAKSGDDPGLSSSLEDYTNSIIKEGGGQPINFSDGSSSVNGSISYQTNNPGNIKWGDFAKSMGATDSGIQATDGGTFAQFSNVDAGSKAQQSLLQSPTYANLTLDQAMKKWSNGAYGADVAPSIKPTTLMKDLTPDQLSTLTNAQKTQEGWSEPTSGGIDYGKIMNNPDTLKNPDQGLSDFGGMTYDGIKNAALLYLQDLGKSPSLGLGGATDVKKARLAVIGVAGYLSNKMGLTLPQMSALYKADSKAVSTQVNFLGNVDRSLTAADNVGNETQKVFADHNINPNDSTWANKTLNDLTKQFGSSGDIRAYQAAMVELGNDYAQVFARGGSRSVEGNNIANNLMNGNVKLSDIQNTLSTLQDIGNIQRNASNSEIQKLSDNISTSSAGVGDKTSQPYNQGYTKEQLSGFMDNYANQMNSSNYQEYKDAWVNKGGDPGDFEALYSQYNQ